MSSPRTAERLSRILAMLPWVIAHPGSTVEEVCERFDYTRPELLKDLNLVLVCGLPGYGPGELMDAFVDEDEVVVDAADYFSRPVRLTAAEALMLLAAGMAVLSSGAAPPALNSAVKKLQSVIAPDAESVTVDIGSEPEIAATLREAASVGRVVTITYTAIGSGETTIRDIEPWGVFSTLGNWYVNGHCRRADSDRVFRVDRIRDLVETTNTFDPPSASSTPEIRYSPSVDDVTDSRRAHGPAVPSAAPRELRHRCVAVGGGRSVRIARSHRRTADARDGDSHGARGTAPRDLPTCPQSGNDRDGGGARLWIAGSGFTHTIAPKLPLWNRGVGRGELRRCGCGVDVGSRHQLENRVPIGATQATLATGTLPTLTLLWIFDKRCPGGNRVVMDAASLAPQVEQGAAHVGILNT